MRQTRNSTVEVSATVADERREHQRLLELTAEGNREAFGELYSKLSARVHGMVRRVLRDPAQSEEVTQDIFIEVWEQAKRYTPSKGGAATWIMTIAHRRAVDRVRSSQASHDRDTRIGIRDFEEGYDNVLDTVQTHIESEKVKTAMERLTELQRQAVTLAYYSGFTQSEVSTMLNVPVGTVKTRLRDGMIRLRDELGVTS
jgi:RNA polymerase sigma-70 factor (ECF subfamily)